MEARRDDPLVDEALETMGRALAAACADGTDFTEVTADMLTQSTTRSAPEARVIRPAAAPSDARIEREARRILRRLCEKGAFLAVAPNMEKAVVLREVVPGRQNRIAVVDRDVAHAFALQEWIACERAGRIAVYTITQVGRAALKRLLTEDRLARGSRNGFSESVTPFGEQHRLYAERTVMADDGSGEQRLRFNLAESRSRCSAASGTRGALPISPRI